MEIFNKIWYNFIVGIGIRDPKVTCLSDFPTFRLRRTSERQGVIFMSKNISDYIGKKYGHLTVIGETSNPQNIPYFNHFDFQCDCGNIISEEPNRVLSGHRTSCGKCHFRKKESKPRFNIDDYIGKKNNMLTVIGIAERLPSDNCWYLSCKCDCGNIMRLTPHQFRKGIIKSCGCLKKVGTRTIDNRTKHPLYGTWKQMIDRCESPSNPKYYRYGKRGIKVCLEWHDFSNFIKWSDSIGGRPDGYTIDRINNDGNYCPENCRWASSYQQSNNKSSNVLLEYNGKTQTLKEWSVETGLKWSILHNRYLHGWNAKEILTTPPKF